MLHVFECHSCNLHIQISCCSQTGNENRKSHLCTKSLRAYLTSLIKPFTFTQRTSNKVLSCSCCACTIVLCVSGVTRGVAGWIPHLICVWQREGHCTKKMPSRLPPCRAEVLFIGSHFKKAKRYFPSLSLLHLSLQFHCIFWSVLLFKCSYSPFRKASYI